MLFSRGSSISKLVVIPVSAASKRLPGKVFKRINGKPLFVHTFENAARSKLAELVTVATGDDEVVSVCDKYRIRVFKNKKKHGNGTSRSYEVALNLGSSRVINLQADEPMIKGNIIDRMFEMLMAESLVTAYFHTNDKAEIADRNSVKVSLDKKLFAVGFSRIASPDMIGNAPIHAGIYGYNIRMLKKYVSLGQSKSEKKESLEQLRFIDNGYKFKVFRIPPVISVNTGKDLARFRKRVSG